MKYNQIQKQSDLTLIKWHVALSVSLPTLTRKTTNMLLQHFMRKQSWVCWGIKVIQSCVDLKRNRPEPESNPEVGRHFTDVITQREPRRRSAPVMHACLWCSLNDRATVKLLQVKRLGAEEGLHCSRTKKQGEEGFLFYTDAYLSDNLYVNSEYYSWS